MRELKPIPEELKARFSGFTSYCGVRCEESDGGYCRCSCKLDERHLNPLGIVHGGVIATLMDVCAGTSAIYAHGVWRTIVTQSADIHYLRPLTGPIAVAESRPLRAGRRTSVVRVDVCGEDGKLCASGIYEFFYVDENAEQRAPAG